MINTELNSGSYQIFLKIRKKVQIEIGALGFINFKRGYYIYTGSAMRNLIQRTERHKKKNKKLHWHIDYLLENEFVEILEIMTFPSESREECERNHQLLNMQNVEIIAKGFGSSDCSKCPTHLVYFARYENIKMLIR